MDPLATWHCATAAAARAGRSGSRVRAPRDPISASPGSISHLSYRYVILTSRLFIPEENFGLYDLAKILGFSRSTEAIACMGHGSRGPGEEDEGGFGQYLGVP